MREEKSFEDDGLARDQAWDWRMTQQAPLCRGLKARDRLAVHGQKMKKWGNEWMEWKDGRMEWKNQRNSSKDPNWWLGLASV